MKLTGVVLAAGRGGSMRVLGGFLVVLGAWAWWASGNALAEFDTLIGVMGRSLDSGLNQRYQLAQTIHTLGPIVAVVGAAMVLYGFYAASKRLEAQTEAILTRPCPFCAEPIRKEALKCKHCGSTVPTYVDPAPDTASVIAYGSSRVGGICPSCGAEYVPGVERCNDCDVPLTAATSL